MIDNRGPNRKLTEPIQAITARTWLTFPKRVSILAAHSTYLPSTKDRLLAQWTQINSFNFEIQFNSSIRSKLSRTMISFSIFVTVAAVMFTRAVHGQSCQSFGVDIGNGGTYYINPASTAQFSFESAFNYCTTSEAPILQLPDGNTITCSSISEATTGAIVTSTWYVMRSALMLI